MNAIPGGEQKANIVGIIDSMAGSRCRVAYIDEEGIGHAVEVEAESLYEAVALATAEFREGEIITHNPSPTTEFSISVLRKPIEHRILFRKVQDWVQPSTRGGPAGIVLRDRLRKLMEGK